MVMDDMKNLPGSNPPSWELEIQDQKLSKKLEMALREVMDPELGLNVIQLGLIRKARLEDDSIEIEMIMTTPFCPYAPMLIEMTQNKAEEVLDMPVLIEIGMEAWDISMMEEGTGFDWGLF